LDPRWWHRNLTTFQKVVVANSAIIAAGAVSGPLITLNFSGRTRLPFLLGLLAIGLIAILVANFLILRLAFKPMRELESTMGAVQPGLEELRVHANFSDPDLRRIATVFNSMLDRLEHERHVSAQRVLQAQERERQRVARELHDQTGQALTHEIISLDLLLERTMDAKARQQLEAVKRTLEETLEEVHRMSQDLRPSVLDDLGLVPALRTLAKQPSGSEVSLHVDGLRDRLSAPIETALYRIAQEALTNANKYARASQVNIDLRCLDGHVRLRVRDDGVGFDPDSIPEKEEPGRAGLERLEKVLLVVVGGEDQHLGLRAEATNVAGDLDPRHSRHGDVDHRHVGAVSPRQPDRLPSFGRLRDHLDVTLPVDHGADSGADQVVVLDQHHLDLPALNLHGVPPVAIAR